MKPFFQFRLWSREGPTSERLLAAMAGVTLVSLVTWAFVPSGQHHSTTVASGFSQVTAAGSGAGATSGSGATNAAATNGPGNPPPVSGTAASASSGGLESTGPSSLAGGGTPATAGRSSSAPVASGGSAGSSGTSTGRAGPAASSCSAARTSTDKGVTANQITIGVLLPDLGQLNPALGLPSAADQEKMFNAVFAAANKTGGAACRTLVPKFYDDPVADASSEQATCLQIQQDGDFAVLQNLYNPQEFNCLAQRDIPNIFYTSPHTPTMNQFFPYVMGVQPSYDRLIKDYVFGAQKLGLLNGEKIGLLEQTCYPDENTDMQADLASIDVKVASVYNYGCVTSGSSEDTPDQDQAAALQFRGAGVTLVLQTARGTVTDFAQAAQAQNYDPKYVMMNDQSMSLVADSSTPIPTSFNGAIAITTDQEGASNTPGAVPTAATQACTKIASSVGEPPPDDQHRLAGQLDGNACAEMTALLAALDHITEPVRTGMAYGLAAAGPLDLSSPAGPMDVTNVHDPTGGQEWRPSAWHTSCNCWIVTNLHWNPGWS
jgi:hypothetical protein